MSQTKKQNMKNSSDLIKMLMQTCELSSLNSDLNALDKSIIHEALLIRLVEEKFIELFSAGKMNGTVHTCVGQEFSAVTIINHLIEEDYVTSNHRCHGHFISKTKNWKGLIDELMGLASGVCKGIGSSQHLCAKGFLSNGPQGALLPVASGIALNKKQKGDKGIVVSFIGEGTLGEGVLYETFNLSSLYALPHLFVCENNFYSQSTPQSDAISGEILNRAKAFEIKSFQSDTWDISSLSKVAGDAINYVRKTSKPAFLLVKTYRLNPHSKGDDNRDTSEITWFRQRDVLNRLLEMKPWADLAEQLRSEINDHIKNADRTVLDSVDYFRRQIPISNTSELYLLKNEKKRMVQALNDAYRATLENGALHIGEDICDPYGGAFKVTKGLSNDFPRNVLNAPISECGLVGVAIGNALLGTESYAEIMFGDFTTNIFDQLINNASKMHHMYAFQVTVPLRVRTPMGGKRGYGPTHSQSLEKLLLGLDNVLVLSLSSLCDPRPIINELKNYQFPIVIIENKVDYARFLWEPPSFLSFWKQSSPFGSIQITPVTLRPTITVITYGETARQIADNYEELFVDTDLLPEIICVTVLHPIDMSLILTSVRSTGKLLTIEDGSIEFGFGAEVIARLSEQDIALEFCLRIGAEDVPIPSVSSLEEEALPSMKRITRLLNRRLEESKYD